MKAIIVSAVLLVALALVGPAYAQVTVTRDCTSAACVLIADAAPAGTLGCRLYEGGTKIGADVALVSGACQLTVPTMVNGATRTFTARHYDAVQESPDSNTVTIISRIPLPAPRNLRLIP